MKNELLGLHHMTAFCGDPQQNVDFYTQTLGLRLVKLTVNFDDPSVYHLYYGDGAGTPGTILTFFPYSGQKGRHGTGQLTVTSLNIRPSSVDYWTERVGGLEFEDPDGIMYRLVPDAGYTDPVPVPGSPVPYEHAIGRIHSVLLDEKSGIATETTLVEIMGFKKMGTEYNVSTYSIGKGGAGNIVQVREQKDGVTGRGGIGAVHHIAFRVADDETQGEWRTHLTGEGYHVSPVMDRDYFHSIYFREAGGVLFELATDPPGFTADEKLENLGTALKLPPQFEPHREELTKMLPPLVLPGVRSVK